MKNEIERKKRYRALRRAGFTSREANLLKDYSSKHVDALIRIKKAERSKITDYLAGRKS
jgi:hypothetical protein